MDRFITLHVRGKRGNEERWNEIAGKLSGISYFIARNFFSINPLTGKTIDIESFMDFFRGSRSDVKSNIISLGIGMIRLWLSSCYQMPLRIESYDYEEYSQDDHLEMLLGWAEVEYRKMERNFGEYDHGEKIFIAPRYIQHVRSNDGGTQWLIFPYAFEKFLKEVGKSFPFRNMHQLSVRYPGRCKYQPRYVKGDNGREQYRILVIKDMVATDEYEDDENLTPQFAVRVQHEVLGFLHPEKEVKE